MYRKTRNKMKKIKIKLAVEEIKMKLLRNIRDAGIKLNNE